MKKDFFNIQIRFMEFCEHNNIDQKKYFLSYSDKRNGQLAAIFEHGESGSISMARGGRFYSFPELIAWMDGYTAAKKLVLFE
ncbi:MAG TPA: hypothetical protein DCL77_14685 [Prolixibacteraceae bacterium]|nr:hypothetical protein [Prolixibacteraceae bacterium]